MCNCQPITAFNMMNLRKRRGYYASKLMAALAGFTALGLSFITWAVLLVTTSEHYCAFMPAIDTHFAPGFTESRFSQIKIGMDSAQVFAVLGKPYSIMRGFEGSGYGFNTIWAYSGDGACWWLGLDFAWLGREVMLYNAGKVMQVRRYVYHD